MIWLYLFDTKGYCFIKWILVFGKFLSSNMWYFFRCHLIGILKQMINFYSLPSTWQRLLYQSKCFMNQLNLVTPNTLHIWIVLIATQKRTSRISHGPIQKQRNHFYLGICYRYSYDLLILSLATSYASYTNSSLKNPFTLPIKFLYGIRWNVKHLATKMS